MHCASSGLEREWVFTAHPRHPFSLLQGSQRGLGTDEWGRIPPLKELGEGKKTFGAPHRCRELGDDAVLLPGGKPTPPCRPRNPQPRNSPPHPIFLPLTPSGFGLGETSAQGCRRTLHRGGDAGGRPGPQQLRIYPAALRGCAGAEPLSVPAEICPPAAGGPGPTAVPGGLGWRLHAWGCERGGLSVLSLSDLGRGPRSPLASRSCKEIFPAPDRSDFDPRGCFLPLPSAVLGGGGKVAAHPRGFAAAWALRCLRCPESQAGCRATRCAPAWCQEAREPLPDPQTPGGAGAAAWQQSSVRAAPAALGPARPRSAPQLVMPRPRGGHKRDELGQQNAWLLG